MSNKYLNLDPVEVNSQDKLNIIKDALIKTENTNNINVSSNIYPEFDKKLWGDIND